jgi:hypothetical protein
MQVDLERTNAHTGVPYEPVQRPDGHHNFGYVDLKKEPEKIDSIPELQDAPELKELVRELNDPRSLFRSVGCEKALGPNSHPVYNCKLTSFVIVVFEILDWNHEENYNRLFQEFNEAMAVPKRMIPDFTSIQFEIHPVTFNAHQRRAAGLTIWVNGYGRNEAEAKENWKAGVAVTQEYFKETRLRFQTELDKGAKTV